MIDVVEEEVERTHALLQAARHAVPLVGRDDARHEIERHDLLRALGPLVHRERDAAHAKRQLGGTSPSVNLFGAQRGEPTRDGFVLGTWHPWGGEHFVAESAQVVRLERRVRYGRREAQGFNSGVRAHASATSHDCFRAVKWPLAP